MKMEDAMSLRTLFLSRLLGLYCIICALSMMVRKQAILAMVTALLDNPMAMFLLGIFTLLAGLAMILAHNLWSGHPLVVIVTLVGWLTLIKGLLFLFLPPQMAAGLFLNGLHYQQLFYLYTAINLVLGAYLAYAGFKSKPE
jgi:putative exporter of polyketide antibiotics